MNRSCAIARAVLLAAVLATTAACAGGTAPPPPAPAPPAPSDAPAAWATTLLDPCALLSAEVVGGLPGAGAPFAVSPHSCGVTVTPATGPADRVVVRVGTAFDTAARAAAAPTTVGGLRAYLTRDVPAGPRDHARCRADLPLSAGRSVQVDAASQGGDLAASCAGTLAVAEPVAARLGRPADLVRPAAASDLGRWNACDLLEKALGWAADRSARAAPDADTCRATPKAAPGSEPAVRVTMAAGPAALGPPGVGERLVDLPSGRALEVGTPSRCALTVVGQELPGAPVDVAVQRVTVVEEEAPGNPCDAAAETVAKITRTVAKVAPDAPETPARLGVAQADPDDVTPVACGAPVGTVGVCRAPRTEDVPGGAASVVRGGSTGPGAADVSCAVLRSVADAVPVPLELAAVEGQGCVGLTGDGYLVTLGFAQTAAERVCTGATGRALVDVAGRPGVQCGASTSRFDLTVPALGTAASGEGVLHVEGRLLPPRGDHVRAQGPADGPRVQGLTTGIAAAVVTRFLGT